MNGFFITLADGGNGRGLISVDINQPNGVIVPPGGYYVFSWINPDRAPSWTQAGGSAITIYQNGNGPAGTMTVFRRDGPDGDPGFNPYGLPDANPSKFTYDMPIPRITSGDNLRFVVRADGSAENILFKLNGGIDLNATVPKPASGTFKYKIGIYRHDSSSWFPGNSASVSCIASMLTQFEIAGFNANTVEYFPHNDYARVQDSSQTYENWDWDTSTGLDEVFHILRARAFLKRDGNLDPSRNGTSIYNTFTQTFYYDAGHPSGEIVFPSENDTLNQQSYGVVVRTD